LDGLGHELTLKSIILSKGRLALAVRNGNFDTSDLNDPEATVLLDLLSTGREHLKLRLPVGIGWLVRPTVVVTNAPMSPTSSPTPSVTPSASARPHRVRASKPHAPTFWQSSTIRTAMKCR